VAHNAGSHSEDSKFFCAPDRASHVEDLVQQSDAGTLNDSLSVQMAPLMLQFLMSSD
jgi:hypothetical protein